MMKKSTDKDNQNLMKQHPSPEAITDASNENATDVDIASESERIQKDLLEILLKAAPSAKKMPER